ncbi:MAG TPA: hypothetical protein VMV69_09985 [Pirellulales bacterium]|nr:hypothetical protein [Pirellulales bacterium]
MSYLSPRFAAAGALGRWRGLLGLAILVLAACKARAEESAAHKLLRDARTALDSHQWVSAKIHQQIDLYEQQLIGNGTYRQGPPESHWMLLDLKVKMGGTNWFVQERCDGESHWQIRTQGATRTELSRIDITRLRKARDDWQAAHGNAPHLGLGGLPKLLGALDQAFEFKTVSNATLARQPVYALRGQWRPERLAKWLPEQKDAIVAGRPVDLRQLPPPIPDHVFVLLGRDDLFPYRIEYGRDDSPIAGKSRILVAMNLDEVAFDEPVEAREFMFDPGAAPVIDLTEIYLQKLALPPKPR